MDTMKDRFRRMKARNFLLVGFIAVLWGVLTFLSPHFIKISNLLLLLQQSSIVMVAGIGMTFAILTSGLVYWVGSGIVQCDVRNCDYQVGDAGILSIGYRTSDRDFIWNV